MWFKDKILQGRSGQFKNCRNLLIWRAQSVIWRLHTDLEQHTLVGHGVQCSLFWRKSGQKWRYSSREAERSRELLQQNCLLKQACHQKHFREKGAVLPMKQKLKRSKRWKIVIILQSGMTGYSFEWLVLLASYLFSFASLRKYTWALQRSWQGSWLWLVIRSQMKRFSVHTQHFTSISTVMCKREILS